MARLIIAANTEGNQEGLEDFTPLETGDYIAIINKSQWKETKAKTGRYLQLVWKIIEGEKKGRTLFDNLNLVNPNPIAVEIANKALNSICQACDKIGVEDSEELHGIPVLLKVVKKPGKDDNPPSNDIKGYLPSVATGVLEPSSEPVSGPVIGANQPDTVEKTPETSGVKEKLPWE